MTIPPRNLEELAKIKDPTARALAAKAYKAERMEAVGKAERILYDAVRILVAEHGVAATARLVGMSTSHIKAIRSKS